MYVILDKIGWTWFAIVATVFLIHQTVQGIRRHNRRAERLRRGFAVKDDGNRAAADTRDNPKQ
jgi:hypothetical protein